MRGLVHFVFICVVVTGALPPAHAMHLCRENLEHVNVSAVFKQQVDWTSTERMNEIIARLREICEQRHGADCEKFGVFGPRSIMWEVSRIPFLAMYAETELYLQLAHPVGAQGVYDHSARLMQDPIRRFQSTFNHLWNMTYGTFSDATRIARIIHMHHTRVVGIMEDTAGDYKKGEIYSATDTDALHWVHATHMFSLLRLYETLERKLTPAETDQFYYEAKLFGMLLGIPEDLLPNNAVEFNAYFNAKLVSDDLSYTSVARKIETHFRSSVAEIEATNPVALFVRKYSDLVTAITLPPQFARRFGLSASGTGRAVYNTSLTAMQAAYRIMPSAMAELPLYRIAMARAEGRTPSPVDVQLSRLMLGGKSPGQQPNHPK